MRIGVLGATGAVGSEIVDELARLGCEAVPTSRNPRRGEWQLDLSAPTAAVDLSALAARCDAIVNASGLENVEILRWCAETPLVDISATALYLRRLRAGAATTTVVLGAGLAPGLSTAAVDAVSDRTGDDIDVFITLGSGERHGAAALAWTTGLLGERLSAAPESVAGINLRQSRSARVEGRSRRYLRCDFPDHELVGAPRGDRVRSWLRLSHTGATLALAVAARMPALAPLIERAPHLGDDRWVVAASNRRTGHSVMATGRGQSRATGVLSAHLAVAAASDPRRGAVVAPDLLGWDAQAELCASITETAVPPTAPDDRTAIPPVHR